MSKTKKVAKTPPTPLTHLEVVAGCVNGDDTVLSCLIPPADAELRGLLEGTGSVMGFSEESIITSSRRVMAAGYGNGKEMPYDDESLAASAFALGFVTAARLFGGVR